MYVLSLTQSMDLAQYLANVGAQPVINVWLVVLLLLPVIIYWVVQNSLTSMLRAVVEAEA